MKTLALLLLLGQCPGGTCAVRPTPQAPAWGHPTGGYVVPPLVQRPKRYILPKLQPPVVRRHWELHWVPGAGYFWFLVEER